MIDVTVHDNLDGLATLLDKVARDLGDLTPIGQRLGDALKRGVTEMILSGRGADGTPVPPLKSTSLRERPGGGPPGAPHGAGSRIVTDMRATIERADDGVKVRVDWPGFAEAVFVLARNHQIGIPGAAMEAVGDVVQQHLEETLGKR